MTMIPDDMIDEVLKMEIKHPYTFDVDLALALSKKVHDMCDNAPHDIGMYLAILVNEMGFDRKIV